MTLHRIWWNLIRWSSLIHIYLQPISVKHISKHFRREVEGFFKILDKNQDGMLSFEEFLGEETHIEKIFRTMDKDNDGYVTKEVSMTSYCTFSHKLSLSKHIMYHWVSLMINTVRMSFNSCLYYPDKSYKLSNNNDECFFFRSFMLFVPTLHGIR